MNYKLLHYEDNEYKGIFLENNFPYYLKFVELTKGKLLLNYEDKYLILYNFSGYYGMGLSEVEKLENTFNIFIQIYHLNKIKDKVLKSKMKTEIIENCRKFKLGSLTDIKRVIRQPINRYLDYTFLSIESYKKNMELFGFDEINKMKN